MGLGEMMGVKNVKLELKCYTGRPVRGDEGHPI